MARSAFGIVRGLRFDAVRVVASQERLALDVEIDHLVAGHAFALVWPPRVDRVRLMRPQVRAVVGRSSTWGGEPPAAPGGVATPGGEADDPSATALSSAGASSEGLTVTLENATIEISPPGADTALLADGMHVVLDRVGHESGSDSLIEGLSGVGTVSARVLGIGSIAINDASGTLELNDGHFLFSDLVFRCGGKDYLLPEVDVDFTSDPFSFGTRSNIFERVDGGGSGPPRWEPVASLTQLEGLCGG